MQEKVKTEPGDGITVIKEEEETEQTVQVKTEREIKQEVTVEIDPEKSRKWKKPTHSDVTEEELSNSKKGKK